MLATLRAASINSLGRRSDDHLSLIFSLTRGQESGGSLASGTPGMRRPQEQTMPKFEEPLDNKGVSHTVDATEISDLVIPEFSGIAAKAYDLSTTAISKSKTNAVSSDYTSNIVRQAVSDTFAPYAGFVSLARQMNLVLAYTSLHGYSAVLANPLELSYSSSTAYAQAYVYNKISYETGYHTQYEARTDILALAMAEYRPYVMVTGLNEGLVSEMAFESTFQNAYARPIAQNFEELVSETIDIIREGFQPEQEYIPEYARSYAAELELMVDAFARPEALVRAREAELLLTIEYAMGRVFDKAIETFTHDEYTLIESLAYESTKENIQVNIFPITELSILDRVILTNLAATDDYSQNDTETELSPDVQELSKISSDAGTASINLTYSNPLSEAAVKFRHADFKHNVRNVPIKLAERKYDKPPERLDVPYFKREDCDCGVNAILLSMTQIKEREDCDCGVTPQLISYSKLRNKENTIPLFNRNQREDCDCGVTAHFERGLLQIDYSVNKQMKHAIKAKDKNGNIIDITGRAKGTVLEEIERVLSGMGLRPDYHESQDGNGFYIKRIKGVNNVGYRVIIRNKNTGELRYIKQGIDSERFNKGLEEVMIEYVGKGDIRKVDDSVLDGKYFRKVRGWQGSYAHGIREFGSFKVTAEQAADSSVYILDIQTKEGVKKHSFIGNTAEALVHKYLVENGFTPEYKIHLIEGKLKLELKDIKDAAGNSIARDHDDAGYIIGKIDASGQRSELLDNNGIKSLSACEYQTKQGDIISLTRILQGLFDMVDVNETCYKQRYGAPIQQNKTNIVRMPSRTQSKPVETRYDMAVGY